MKPALEPEAARLYQQLAPMAVEDEATGWVTAHLCAVLMKPVELVTQLATEVGDKPGWADAVDVEKAPAQLLPWQGQFNGTPLADGEPEAEQRRKIREARGSHRGKVSAIISDLKATLTGTQSVTLIERDEGPFNNTFVTLASETPDEGISLAALNDRQTKPLGVINTLVASNVPLIDEFTREIEDITAEIEHLTLEDVT